MFIAKVVHLSPVVLNSQQSCSMNSRFQSDQFRSLLLSMFCLECILPEMNFTLFKNFIAFSDNGQDKGKFDFIHFITSPTVTLNACRTKKFQKSNKINSILNISLLIRSNVQ